MFGLLDQAGYHRADMDLPGHGRSGVPQLGDDVVRRFACRVVTELARSAGVQSGQPVPGFLDSLVSVVRSGDPAHLMRIHDEMRRRRISAEQVIDIYFPAVIERIGTAWHEAQINVLEATVALSRLQQLLRELGRAWQADRARSEAMGCVLLILPQTEHHALGAMLAANQLRRMGVSVRVALMAGPSEAEALVLSRSFDAVFLSVSNLDAKPVAGQLVAAIRQRCGSALPVVVGGGLTAFEATTEGRRRLAAELGADLATIDLREAIGFCGLQRFRMAAE